MTAPRHVRRRNRALLATIAPVFILVALFVVRSPGDGIRPFEADWLAWVFAVLATGIGIGYGWARLRH